MNAKRKTLNKRTYYILSGEGTGEGTWRYVTVTDRGIKRMLTTERCGGDRWAKAYSLVRNTILTSPVGVDIETGDARDMSTVYSMLHF